MIIKPIDPAPIEILGPALMMISALIFLLPRSFDGGTIYLYALKMNAAKYFWPFALGFILYFQRSTMLAFYLGVAGAALVLMFDDAPGQLAVLTFAASYVLLLFARSGIGSRSKFLDYLGDISYPLYLVQILFYVVAFRVFAISNAPLLLAGTIAAACCVYGAIDVRLKRQLFSSAMWRYTSALQQPPRS